MKRFLSQLASFFLTILFITFIAFLLLHLASSDPAEIRLARTGVAYTQEQLETLREELGLKDSFLIQYIRWLGSLLKGDFGISMYSGLPVKKEVLAALPNTLFLAFMTLLLTAVLTLTGGFFCALHQDSLFDRIIMTVANILAALPGYFVSLLLLLIFALRLSLFPVIVQKASFQALILPATALAVGLIPDYIRQIRAIISRELQQPYVLGARSRGIRERDIFMRHVIRNSALPLLNLVGISLGTMIGGSIIIETIFGWPGLGLLAMDAISHRDYTMLQGYIVIVAAAYFLINSAVDLFGKKINPQWGGVEK